MSEQSIDDAMTAAKLSDTMGAALVATLGRESVDGSYGLSTDTPRRTVEALQRRGLADGLNLTAQGVRVAHKLAPAKPHAKVVAKPHALFIDGKEQQQGLRVGQERVQEIADNARAKRLDWEQLADGTVRIETRHYVPQLAEEPQGVGVFITDLARVQEYVEAQQQPAAEVPVSVRFARGEDVAAKASELYAPGDAVTVLGKLAGEIVRHVWNVYYEVRLADGETREYPLRELAPVPVVAPVAGTLYKRHVGGLGLGWSRPMCDDNGAAVREVIERAQRRGDAVVAEDGGVIRVEGAGVIDPGFEGAGGRGPVWFVPLVRAAVVAPVEGITYRLHVGIVRDEAKDMGDVSSAGVQTAIDNANGWPVESLAGGVIRVGYSFFEPVPVEVAPQEAAEAQQQQAAEVAPHLASYAAELLGEGERWMRHFYRFGADSVSIPVDREGALNIIVPALRHGGWVVYRVGAGGVSVESPTGESSYWLEPVTPDTSEAAQDGTQERPGAVAAPDVPTGAQRGAVGAPVVEASACGGCGAAAGEPCKDALLDLLAAVSAPQSACEGDPQARECGECGAAPGEACSPLFTCGSPLEAEPQWVSEAQQAAVVDVASLPRAAREYMERAGVIAG